MKEDQYDLLRKKLNIDSLDDKTKKKLMEDFKKAGGKIDYSIFEKKYGKDSRLEYLDLLKKTTSKASKGLPSDKEIWIGGKEKKIQKDKKNKLDTLKDKNKISSTKNINEKKEKG